MKKHGFLTRICLLLATLMLFCVGCRVIDGPEAEETEDVGVPIFTEEVTEAPDPEKLRPLTYDAQDDVYRDEDGNRYRVASIAYEPVAVGEPYAAAGTTVLYRLANYDPADWLTEAYEGHGSIFYSDRITLPTLEELSPDAAVVCVQGSTTLGLGTIEDKALLEKLIRQLMLGRAVETEIPDDIVYSVKLASKDHPQFYYSLTYYEKKDGTRCIYDRTMGKSVVIGDMLSDYIATREEMREAGKES